jgi:hypothetical protein
MNYLPELAGLFSISASQVARITGVSHRCVACFSYFSGKVWQFFPGAGQRLILLSVPASHPSGVTGVCHNIPFVG